MTLHLWTIAPHRTDQRDALSGRGHVFGCPGRHRICGNRPRIDPLLQARSGFLAKRHEISRNLVRIWVAKYEAGSFDSNVVSADMMQAQEARIGAPERLAGRLWHRRLAGFSCRSQCQRRLRVPRGLRHSIYATILVSSYPSWRSLRSAIRIRRKQTSSISTIGCRCT